MKRLAQFIALFVAGNVWSANPGPADVGNVNLWAELALKVDLAKLTERGRRENFVCQRGDNGDVTYGKNEDLARGKAFALCLRKQCDTIEGEVNAEIDRLRGSSREEIEDFLTALGHGQNTDQLMALLASGGYGEPSNCQSNMLTRYMIYESCRFRGYLCGKISRKK